MSDEAPSYGIADGESGRILEWRFKSGDEEGVEEYQTMTFHDGPSIIPISRDASIRRFG